MSIGRKAIVLIVVILMLGMANLPAVGGGPDASGGRDRGLGLLSTDPWTDSLDDLSNVYVPASGLVGIEVSGGDAHLKAGESRGWLASEIISAPPGYRYDLVLLEVDTPGASYVEVSILNATADPSEIGYANETIGGFKLRTETDLSVFSIGPKMYPDIRIQVNLNADGTDRPRLLSWTLYFIGLEEWRDDFRGTGKMSENSNLNLTGDTLEVNLSAGATGGGSGVGDYDAYPTIAVAGYYDVDLLYPNTGHTGYDDSVSIDGTYVWFTDFSDLDKDGYMDLIVSDRSDGVYILWGSASGTYSSSSKTIVTTDDTYGAVAADFNGDGWYDLGIAGFQTDSSVYLNDGSGDFNAQADVTISGTMYYIDAGDVNGDSFDDLIFSYSTTDIYYGGLSGPVTSPSKSLGGSLYFCEDLNLDGFDDVVTRSGDMKIYLGDSPDIDTVAAYSLSTVGSPYYPAAGDVNGDGFIDIGVTDYVTAGNVDIAIFEGGSDGWKTSRKHTIDVGGYGRMAIADLDKDGYEDIIHIGYAAPSYTLKVYHGKSTWPSTASITKTMTYVYNLAVAIPVGEGGGARAYRGTFTTEEIDLPLDKKWDVAFLDGTFPLNTSSTITVLDSASGSAIAGYKDVRSIDLDLSGINPAIYRSIQLKVSIETEFNTTTPVVDSLTVKWMDKRVWRDEFYGDAKVERMLNMGVAGGQLGKGSIGGQAPQLIFPTLLGEANYTTSPLSFSDAGGLDYVSRTPFEFKVKGSTAADVADVDGDGYLDIAFSVKQTAPDVYGTMSPLFMGGPLGMQQTPQHRFDTTGATDVILEDIDGDGYIDVVFAQMMRTQGDYSVNSTLYWGSADGWSDTPDMEFATKGASGVEAVDIDGDDDMDLAFACYRDSGTSTDSMVFLQGTEGFCATAADYKLPTKGATAVAAGDIDDDGFMDLVFANNLSGGFAEIDSWVYWGKMGGGFEASPLGLATLGASDVKVADLDGDGDLDIVFANQWDNSQDQEVDSIAYLNDDNREFLSSGATKMPTLGATGVAVVDLDGTGWMDLVFSNQRNANSYQVPSYVYLGGASGWSSTPDIELPTEGAYDVVAAGLIEYGTGGYLSNPIVLDDLSHDTGSVHTFRYSATMGASISGEIRLVDSYTWEVLGETSIQAGTNEWDVQGLFRVKEHPVVRIMITMDGLATPGSFALDDLWLNWTKRIRTPPQVLDLGVSEPSVYRLDSVDLWVNVTDDYDLPGELMVLVQHRINGTGAWKDYLIITLEYDEKMDGWFTTITPRVDAELGMYDFRVDATDLDSQFSDWVVFPEVLEIMNNLPTTPVVVLEPATPTTMAQLRVELVTSASDLETAGLQYIYRWYLDGELMADLTDDLVPTYHTAKGQNWSVEVSAWDGDDEGPRATAWVIIGNAPPSTNIDLPDPDLDEDTTDSDWLDLSIAFKDDDGDPITWSLASESENLSVTIDHDTGMVTLVPKANWNGDVTLVFVASDGEDEFGQTVIVTVNPVNDLPTITYVDGKVPATDPLVYTMKQGETLVISYDVADVEGDEVQALVNNTAVTHDEVARTITFEAGNDAVGTLRFGLRIWDVVSTSEKISLNFVIEIEDENDPMEKPRITSPLSGEKFKVNQSFSLVAFADDPDIPHGQVLLYVWSSNISGELGRGPSITVQILEPGTHEITVTVSDPDFSKSTFIMLYIEPKEVVGPPDDDDPLPTTDDTNWIMIAGILIALVIVGAVLFMVIGKKRTEAYEAKMDAEMDEEEKKESMKRAHAAIKELADEWEAEKEGSPGGAAPSEYEEIKMDGLADSQLAMEASVTAEASDDVQKLFSGVGAAVAEQSEEDKNAMRVENAKRTYQNAIGRLPYGIPSKELADRDWVELANSLATGEKTMVEGGQEVTNIDGRWYYSDAKDTGSFLKEHGAKPKEEPKRAAAPAADKEKLLAKLEERFIMGEISEEAYKELKDKYGG